MYACVTPPRSVLQQPAEEGADVNEGSFLPARSVLRISCMEGAMGLLMVAPASLDRDACTRIKQYLLHTHRPLWLEAVLVPFCLMQQNSGWGRWLIPENWQSVIHVIYIFKLVSKDVQVHTLGINLCLCLSRLRAPNCLFLLLALLARLNPTVQDLINDAQV